MTMAFTGAVILVLAPHTDDGELGVGGSIARWTAEGNDVHYVGFSACETIRPPDQEPMVLRRECAAATWALGIPQENLRILDFEVRHFARDRQAILDAMVHLNGSLRPDLVLLPSLDDTHQDHEIVASEARRAFKRTRLLGYEVPWNNFRFDVTSFVRLESEHCEQKWEALQHFATQSGRPYMTREYVQSQARFRGVQAGCEFAEAFQVLRWYL